MNADRDAHLLQLGDENAQMPGLDIADRNIAAGGGGCCHQGAGHESVRHRRIFNRVEPADAIDE